MIGNTDRVTLPIGVEVDGIRYREVVIDEMTGIDEENLASPKIQNNGGKAVTLLLQRCIQEIVGVVDRKKSRMTMIDQKIIKKMYAADRDYLVLCIKGLSSGLDISGDVQCTSCGATEFRELNFSNLDVYEWEEGERVEIEIELPRGFYDERSSKYFNKLVWKLPDGRVQEKLASVKNNEVATYMMASGIVSVEGLDYRPSTSDVRTLSLTDRNYFAECIVDNSVGVDTNMEFECEHCGDMFEKEVDIMGFFSLGGKAKKKPTSSGKSGRRLRKRT